MLEPGWKVGYLLKTQTLKQRKVGWMRGKRDGGRAREERGRRSDGNGQREKAELCMRILYAIVRPWTFPGAEKPQRDVGQRSETVGHVSRLLWLLVCNEFARGQRWKQMEDSGGGH